MKIVVLNDSFLNKEHQSKLAALGDLTFYESTTTTAEAIERVHGADIVIGDQYLVEFNKTFFESVQPKLLALNSTSYAWVDASTAKERGVHITNTPGFSSRAVAELAIGLMLDVVRKISYGERKFRANPWEPDPSSKADSEFIGYEVENKTVGIIGLGNIGCEMARLSQGLGMKTIAWNRSPKTLTGVEMVDLNDLVQRSDVVMIAQTYSEESNNTLNAELIGKLKPNAALVSIGKIELLDREALHQALKENKIRGAALDLSQAKAGDPLLDLENIVLTPHLGAWTEEAFYKNLPDMIVSNVEAFVKGSPVNVVV